VSSLNVDSSEPKLLVGSLLLGDGMMGCPTIYEIDTKVLMVCFAAIIIKNTFE
jgi:hypothetical protein